MILLRLSYNRGFIKRDLGHSSENLSNLPLLLLFHVKTLLFICTRSIYSLIIIEEGKFWDVELQAI